ncbi:MAG TPA: prolyl-tRNA synthetase associated domain-containing protein [Alphaproteobacteria bacterium]
MTENQTFDPPYALSPDALLAHLTDLGIVYERHHHDPIFTAAEGGHLKALIPGIHVKNLFVRDKKERMALIVVPDEISLDLKTLAPAIGLDRLSFGSPERLWANLGVRPGSVCPYAAMNDQKGLVKVVVHQAIAEGPRIVAHPMINTQSIVVSSADLLRFLQNCGHTPQIIDLNAYARCDAA